MNDFDQYDILKSIIEVCPQLEFLEIYGPVEIDADLIEFINQQKLMMLDTLILRNAFYDNITLKEIINLVLQKPNLNKLKITHPEPIKSEMIIQILKQCTKLKEFKVELMESIDAFDFSNDEEDISESLKAILKVFNKVVFAVPWEWKCIAYRNFNSIGFKFENKYELNESTLI